MLVIQETLRFIKGKRFVNIATCDLDNRPNVAPKFLLKIKDNYIYLVDYVRNTTLKNIRVNPRISISFIDMETLKGYQINGSAEILESGKLYDKLFLEYEEKQIDLSTQRLINSLHAKKKHSSFEAELPKEMVILKIQVNEAVAIGLHGNLEREKI